MARRDNPRRRKRLPAIVGGLVAISVSVWGQTVEIYPGTDIQSVVDQNQPGTTYILKAGIHRLQSIVPHDGDKLQGEPGAILDGATVLSSFVPDGDVWSIGDQVPQGVYSDLPGCMDGHDGCTWSEDLFFDGVPLEHVNSLDNLAPGKWFFDMPNQTIYVADDPTNHLVERSVIAQAFHSDTAANVTIAGLVVEEYATPARMGTIQAAAPGWTIQDNEICLNHGTGIDLRGQGQVLRNYIHDNGQLGLGVYNTAGALIEDNEIAFNNFAWFDFVNGNAEAGATKFATVTGLIARGNFVHDNHGPGLWSDVHSSGTLYEDNVVTDNDLYGILDEVSSGGIIRNNISASNGTFSAPVGNSQIVVANSANTEVYNNDVEADAPAQNGILLYQDNRGPDNTVDNYVHDNTVTYVGDIGPPYFGEAGQTGFWDYQNPDPLYNGNNRFDSNHYYVTNLGDAHWLWKGSLTWADFQAAGFEANGTLDILP